MTTAQQYIEKLGLQPHPEGGYFAECYRSQEAVKPASPRYQDNSRCAGTSIYYLLEKNDFSAWHKVNSDEGWHYYHGSPVYIHRIDKTGQLSTVILGDPLAIKKASFQAFIPAGDWFSAELLDKTSFVLVGCTVSPGFEFVDFELAKREELVSQFPVHENIITRLSR